MKKFLYLSVACLSLAACTSESLVDENASGTSGKEGPISFVMAQKNTTRASQALQTAGHYNFGVFAYKSTDKVNNIMENYLVGYHNDANAYSTSGTTVGDTPGQVDGVSQWMYEGLGNAEFTGTYAGQRLNAGDAFASNVANQYLRYWDKAAENTYFYAYAPYVNTTATGKTVTYVDGQEVGTSSDKYVMTIPFGTIEHATVEEGEDYSLYEFMYASAKVAKANYGHDVALNFNRLNAKVNIKFWEDIPGYNVRIIDVDPTHSVSAVPAIKDGTSGKYGYKLGAIYTQNGAKIQFADGVKTAIKQYEGATTDEPINFKAPTAAQIGENRLQATPSTTTYFAIPKGDGAGVLSNTADNISVAGTLNTDLAETGLTFHVSYELISNTGEVITVKDATVFVPTEYTNWAANTHYTYIFKITKNSNGTTDSDDTPNPTDPEVPTEPALYPIVFDNCTVVDWDEIESEHIITEGTAVAYHNVILSTYSITNGAATDITVTIEDNDKSLVHPVDYANVTVTAPNGSDVSSWYTSGTKTIAVPANAAAGVYTVTYTCATGDVYENHPTTWTAKFYVGNAYVVSTNLDEVGTHGLDNSALSISATKDADSFVPTAAQLSIEYPVNLTAAEKALVKVSSDGTKVEVAKTAAPGKYKLVLTIDEGENGVKVAEKVFEVKDYQFILSTYAVKLGASPVVINATCPGTGVLSMTAATGITVDDAAKTISVANTAAEGTYTVTYTVQGSTVSEVKYQKTFTVANTYEVSLNKNVLQRDLGRANEATQGTDQITITTLKNGEASNGETAKLKIKLGTTDVTSNFTIDCVQAGDPAADTNTYTLKVNKEAAVNEVYTIEYTGQTGKVATVDFTVQK